jgi:alpha-methylacyl-CoA racemase
VSATPVPPLARLRVVEVAGTVPGSFAAMLLGDLGADVLRVDRATPSASGAAEPPRPITVDLLGRGRQSIAADLKLPAAVALLGEVLDRADVVIEGFRPGVMERLGLGPEECLARNPRLVYGRLTGWGQHGPLAHVAGHDINYLAIAGLLHAMGRSGAKPVVPTNVVGDFAAGGLMLAFGVLAALLERERSGLGQVVDGAMVDGVATLSTFLHSMLASGQWTDDRGVNVVDGGAPYYDTYETADDKYIAVGAVEPKFYAELLRRLSLEIDPAAQNDIATWPATRAALEVVFRQRTRAEWCELLEGTDVCFSPVLSLREAADHPHNRARGVFRQSEGVAQPAPAPRFSRSTLNGPGKLPSPESRRGAASLHGWGIAADVIDAAVAAGALAR